MTQDVVSVEIPGNRDDVLKILKRTGISGVPVIKDGQIVGIITRKDLLRNPDETQLGLLMTPDPITIGPEATIADAARLMVRHCIRRLPVVEGRQLIGLLSVSDLILAIAQMKCTIPIRDVYTSQTFAIWEETPLTVVGRIMEISGFDAIPILDADNTLRGIISERDLIRNSVIEDSVGISDFSNGTDDDEWTWESIRDNHTLSVLDLEGPDPEEAGQARDDQERDRRAPECRGERVRPQDEAGAGRPAPRDQRGQAPGRHALRSGPDPGPLHTHNPP